MYIDTSTLGSRLLPNGKVLAAWGLDRPLPAAGFMAAPGPLRTVLGEREIELSEWPHETKYLLHLALLAVIPHLPLEYKCLSTLRAV